MSELNKKFHKASGINLRYDLEEKLAAVPENERFEAFKKIVWQIPGGGITGHGEKANEISDAVKSIAEKLGFEYNDADFNKDGVVDNDERRIMSKIEVTAKEESTADNDNKDDEEDGGEDDDDDSDNLSTIEVENKLESGKSYTISGEENLNFNGKEIDLSSVENADKDAIVVNGGNVSIENVEIKGATLDETTRSKAGIVFVTNGNVNLKDVKLRNNNPVYIPNDAQNATVTIESGEYTTENASQAVYVGSESGKVVIESGKFYARPWPTSETTSINYCLNLRDSLLTVDPEDDTLPRKYIEVKGGTFVGFDPSNSEAEAKSLNYQVSFVDLEKYKVVKKGTETVKSDKSPDKDLVLDVYEVQPK